MKIESFFAGKWHAGRGNGQTLRNPVNQEVLGHVDATGIDVVGAFADARKAGVASLADLSFQQRGAILKSVADVLVKNRDRYNTIARLNSGNTARDASVDIDGGIGVLKFYARLAERLGSSKAILEPGQDLLAKEPAFFARHFWHTRPGVALQVNAYNFPSWGMWEKIAVALVAGVPSITKPASSTALLSYEMMRDVVAAFVLPEGSVALICGAGGPLIGCLTAMDSLAFTGSAQTALGLRGELNVLASGPRVTVETDSLNATIIGPDVQRDSAVFELAVSEIVKALSVKAGQFCTNIRRILVPEAVLPALQEAVAQKLTGLVVGDPADPDVKVGPLVNTKQRDTAIGGIEALSAEAKLVAGGTRPQSISEADWSRGAFVAPTLLRCDNPEKASSVHSIEVFGPCATLMPYRSLADVTSLAAAGGGSLVASVFSNDSKATAQIATGLAPWHGRLLLIDEEVGKNHTGHAIVMPQCVHGGPGRAGGGEEQGSLRALRFHMQRTAVQASASFLGGLGSEYAEITL